MSKSGTPIPNPVSKPGSTGTAFLPEALQGVLRTSETVVNPERRGVAVTPASDSSGREISSSLVGSLFPTPENGGNLNPTGIELGHFRVVSAIRSGGMGAVFEALDLRLNRTVALKILPPIQSRDPSSVNRFRHEAQAAAQLDHDNIARVFFIGEERGLHFIAFEFIRGTNLRELVAQRGRLAPAEAVNYILQITSALCHTAAKGVIHRDIKPSNIIVTASGRAKLVDMGLARSERRENQPELTVAGTTLGTFDYLAPEQAKDPRSVDVRSDIYSLGCTLYHLLTGEPPYPEGTVLQKLLDHQAKEAPDPRLKNRQVSDALAHIVRKMMASDIKRRYQSPESLLHDLWIVAGQLGLRAVSPEAVWWMQASRPRTPLWERHASWLITAAVLLILVGVVNFTSSFSPNSSTKLAGSPISPTIPQASPDTDQLPSKNNSTGEIVANANSKETNAGASNVDNPGETSPKSNGVEPSNNVASNAATTNSTEGQKNKPPIANAVVNLREPGEVFNTGVSELAGMPIDLTTLVPAPETINPATVAANPGNTTSTQNPATVAIASNGEPTGPSVNNTPPTNPQGTKPAPAADVGLQPSIALLKSDGTGGQSFPTLEAACAVAQDGNVIELRFNGIRNEFPLRINSKITIRSGKGFRPILEFLPREIPGSTAETRMINVTSGSLDLVDIHLAMVVRDQVTTDEWVLLSLNRPDALRLEQVGLTVHNLTGRPASFIELKGGTSRVMIDPEMMNSTMMKTPLAIDISRSYIRGSAHLFHEKSPLSARLQLKDTLLALNGALLRGSGAMDLPDPKPELELRLDHVTAVLNQGLLRLEEGGNPKSLGRTLVVSSNSIFTTVRNSGQPASPFFWLEGTKSLEDLRQLVVWNGQKNFYDGFETFWSMTSSFENRTTTMNFSDWRRHWSDNETDGQATLILWQKAWSESPFRDLVPADFALEKTSGQNPAISAANNGADAGVDLEKLAKLIIPPRTTAVQE